MQLEINSRHFTLADDIREKIVEKLEGLKRYSPTDPVAIRMTLTQTGGRFTGDLSLNLKQHSCHAKVEHVEPDGAAAMAIESVERQLRRHKDKVKDHRGRADEGGLGLALTGLGAELLDNEGSVFEEEGFRLKDLTVEQAEEFYADSDAPFFVFRNIETGKIAVVYKRDNDETGLMKPE